VPLTGLMLAIFNVRFAACEGDTYS